MSDALTLQKGDVILCDINTTQSGSGIGSTIYYTTAFNFHPGEGVQVTLEKAVWVVQKPGVPVGYEIGLGERTYTITTTIKSPIATLKSLADLYSLCKNQYNTTLTAGGASYGIVKFWYYGDRINPSLIGVAVKSLWYEQRPGGGSMFDIRVSVTEVAIPGT